MEEEKTTQKISIELTRYKSLLEALGDWKKVFRVIVTLFVTGVLLFAGITLVVLSIKRIYPYSDITTNALGSTTIKNEKTEVSYWLLNTAELWANSGIHVKKGQTITVRASGKKHTAIHHLVEETRQNKAASAKSWVGTSGFDRSADTGRDVERARYRIFPSRDQDALVMQVVPEGARPDDRPQYLDKRPFCAPYLATSRSDFIFVGEQRENIHIEQDGVLYFTINDIVLDDETVTRMMMEIGAPAELRKNYSYGNPELQESDFSDIWAKMQNIRKIRKDYARDTTKLNTFYTDRFVPAFAPADTTALLNNHFGFGTNEGTRQIELYGYFMNRYKEPWYEDNVGSFLILVETATD